MAVATYCYYKKVHRTMHTAIVLYLLNLTLVILEEMKENVDSFEKFQTIRGYHLKSFAQ